jgi:hypothetical protein
VKCCKVDLKLYKFLRTVFSLVLLLLRFGSLGTGGGEVKCFSENLFHDLKNLLQFECAFERGTSDSAVLFLVKSELDSKPVKQASITPLGDDPSCLSLSMSEALKSTKWKPKHKK